MHYYMLTMLLLLATILALWANVKVKSNYKKFSNYLNSANLTGEEAAKLILDKNGIHDINIQPISGELSDHYDPKAGVVRLSEGVYGKKTISAISIAAHEIGHVIQHKEGYSFYKLRSYIAPVVGFTSNFTMLLIIMGMILNIVQFIDLGIILFLLATLFHVVTLPVELDASRRAIRCLENYNMINVEEVSGAKKVLTAAAMTYIASTLISIIQLLRFIAIRNSRD